MSALADDGNLDLRVAAFAVASLLAASFALLVASNALAPQSAGPLPHFALRATTSAARAPAGPFSPRPRASFFLRVGGTACLWFAASLSIVHLNRLVFGFLGGRLAFPLTVTTGHMLIKGLLAALIVFASRAYVTPELLLLTPAARLRARWGRLLAQHRLDAREFAAHVVPMGAATALDVWLSNVSLRTLDVSVYTTAKGTALAWNLALSIALRLVTPAPRVVASVLALLAGVLLCSLKPVGADGPGLAAALAAAACGAARWVLTERFLSRPGVREAPDVVLLAALIAPVTVVTLLPALAVEVREMVLAHALADALDLKIFVAAILGGGVVALALVATELLLLKMTSALSVSVIGHVKDLAAIVMSVFVFGDALSPTNWLGVVLTIAATTVYSLLRARGEGTPEAQQLTGGAESAGTAGGVTSAAAGAAASAADGVFADSSPVAERRAGATSTGSQKRTRAPSSSRWQYGGGVDTTGLGGAGNASGGGDGGGGTVHVSLDDDEDDDDDEGDRFVVGSGGGGGGGWGAYANSFRRGGAALASGGRVGASVERASLLPSGGTASVGGVGLSSGARSSVVVAMGASAGASMTSPGSTSVSPTRGTSSGGGGGGGDGAFAYSDGADDDLFDENEDDDNDIGLGGSDAGQVPGETFDNDESRALDRELEVAARGSSPSAAGGGDSVSSGGPASSRGVKRLPPPVLPYGLTPSSLLLTIKARENKNVRPLGRGLPHVLDKRNADAAAVLRSVKGKSPVK